MLATAMKKIAAGLNGALNHAIAITLRIAYRMRMTAPAPAPASRQPWREEPPALHSSLAAVDLRSFGAELDALHARLKAELGVEDLVHLARMARWGRLCTLLGYASAWLFPNPLAALLIAQGITARWGNVAHHVLHRGYDAVPGCPPRWRSGVFARGWRRFLDWPDWIIPEAWCHEHNQLHHYHTGQREDPDLVERNAWLIRAQRVPRPLKWLMLGVFMLSWKALYYAPNTLWTLRRSQRLRAAGRGDRAPRLATPGEAWRIVVPGERLLWPGSRDGLAYYLGCLLPYTLFRFGLVPALFLPLGTWAWLSVLLTSLMAEAMANLWSFLIIAPNHTGDDLHRFDGGTRGRAEFYLQQVSGSVNYTSRGPVSDFLMCHLNYQIEHHLWPDLPALKYREAAPEVRRICERHGVPYVEESLWRRIGKLFAILLGDGSMRRTDMQQDRAMRDLARP
ncbi:fatty acid desaturase family protein [Pseudomarimonas salicorniae]|uniref:Fatty acid desaturase n=1 Tax=Pseudomarimonas salicorniae TaxID=2933270 RepID=A0ABT0GBY1_9GAMM|nr:fatty acid desaturase [Lysobacter sp. CAU 1642]MCK7592060.1 fatty acid desaturase [Lysobacter sp. CAU 1642]